MSYDNIIIMLLDITPNGVSPAGYAAFTEYLVVAGSDVADRIARTYYDLTSTAYQNLYLFLGFFLVLVAFVIILFFYFLGLITFLVTVITLLMIMVTFGLFYVVLNSFADEANVSASREFGEATAKASLYVGSSLYRDFLYLVFLK